MEAIRTELIAKSINLGTVGTDTVSPNVRWKRDDVRWRKEEGRSC